MATTHIGNRYYLKRSESSIFTNKLCIFNFACGLSLAWNRRNVITICWPTNSSSCSTLLVPSVPWDFNEQIIHFLVISFSFPFWSLWWLLKFAWWWLWQHLNTTRSACFCDDSSTLLDLLACDDSSTLIILLVYDDSSTLLDLLACDDSSTLLELLGNGDDVRWWLSQLLHVRPRNHNVGKLIALAKMCIPVFKVKAMAWTIELSASATTSVTSKFVSLLSGKTYKLHSY